MRITTIKKYLMPGLVFQSVIIAGGYGTGRELVEFFMMDDPGDGFIGMAIATILFSVVMAISFEFGRFTRSYDYGSFVRNLLGPARRLYEILYAATLLLVTAVIGSASGLLLHRMCEIPPIYGTIGFTILVSFVVFSGSRCIERFFAIGSVALYIAYAALVICASFEFGDVILQNASIDIDAVSALPSGIKYAAYNVGIVPALLFSIRHLKTRREAVTAGLIAGPIAMIPAALLYLAMLGCYPEIASKAIPIDYLLERIGFPVLRVIFSIVLFVTFVETGSGLVHGFNERLSEAYRERGFIMPKFFRPAIAAALLLGAIFLASKVGLIALIGEGYGTITWIYLCVFVLPLLTVGTRRIACA